MKLLVDNNLSPRIGGVLRAAVPQSDCHIEHLRYKFSPNAPDDKWISALGNEGGWALLTLDRKIGKQPHLKQLWKATDLVIFFLQPAWRKLTPVPQAGRLLLRWQEIADAFKGATPPCGFEVPLTGRIKRMRF